MALALCRYDEPTALHYVRYSAGSAPRARQAWGAAADYSLERHHRWTEAEAATLARLYAAAGCMQIDQSRAPAPASPCGGRIAADDAEVAELLARMKHAATCRCSDDFGKMWGRIDRCDRRVPSRADGRVRTGTDWPTPDEWAATPVGLAEGPAGHGCADPPAARPWLGRARPATFVRPRLRATQSTALR